MLKRLLKKILKGVGVLVGIPMLMCPLYSSAETVSRKQAETVARKFFYAAGIASEKSPKLVYDGRRLTTHRLFPPFFLFNNPAGGFVVIASDNKAFPILGFSKTGNFRQEDVKGVLKGVMEGYARDIEYIRHDGRVPAKAAEAWINLEGYISGLLSPEGGGDEWFNMSLEEVSDDVRLRHKAIEFSNPGAPDEGTGKPVDLSDEAPFSFFECFLTRTEEERAEIDRRYEERLIPVEPVVTGGTGGNYRVVLPERVILSRVYNLEGMMVDRHQYGETATVELSLDKEASGLYLVVISGESGKQYCFKFLKN